MNFGQILLCAIVFYAVLRLVAFFLLTHKLGILNRCLGEIWDFDPGEDAPRIYRLKELRRKLRNAYNSAIPYASLLLYWPFVPWLQRKKEIYKVFNGHNKFLDWDPSPFVWKDLCKGRAQNGDYIERASQEEIERAVRVLELAF